MAGGRAYSGACATDGEGKLGHRNHDNKGREWYNFQMLSRPGEKLSEKPKCSDRIDMQHSLHKLAESIIPGHQEEGSINTKKEGRNLQRIC